MQLCFKLLHSARVISISETDRTANYLYFKAILLILKGISYDTLGIEGVFKWEIGYHCCWVEWIFTSAQDESSTICGCRFITQSSSTHAFMHIETEAKKGKKKQDTGCVEVPPPPFSRLLLSSGLHSHAILHHPPAFYSTISLFCLIGPSLHPLSIHSTESNLDLDASSGSRFILCSPPPCVMRSHLTRHL